MGMIESSMEEWACEKAEQHGWLVRKMAWVGRRNAPDRFLAKEGRIVLLEAKKTGERARRTQAKEHQALRDAGVEVHVCDNPLAMLSVLGISYDSE